MSKALEECWAGYKDAMKERGFGKIFPRLRKKDIARMSFHDVLELAFDKFTCKNAAFDKPFGELSDEEWDEMNEFVDRRMSNLNLGRALGFDEPKDDTPPIYGEEQNN